MPRVFAEFETNIRRERQMEGIFKTKTKGVYKGGKQRISRERVRQLAESGLGPAAIGREVGATAHHATRVMDELGFGPSTNGRARKSEPDTAQWPMDCDVER